MIIKTSYSFMKPPPSARLIRGHRLSQGLAGAWTMAENGGLQVFDSSENNNTGILTGTAPGWSSGKYGSAIKLPGSNEYISIANSPSIQVFNAITVVMFYKSSNTSNMAFFAKGYKDLYLRRKNSTTVIMFYDQLTGGNVEVIIGSEVCDGLPHMIVYWWDGANSKVWFDGVDKGGEATTGTIDTGSVALEIGRIGAIAWYSDMLIDLTLIYNRALSASEITELYWKPFCMFERKARTALMSGYEVVAPPVGMAGAMTTNTGYWGW